MDETLQLEEYTYTEAGFDDDLNRGIVPFGRSSSGLVSASEFEATSEGVVTSLGANGGFLKMAGGKFEVNDGSNNRVLIGFGTGLF